MASAVQDVQYSYSMLQQHHELTEVHTQKPQRQHNMVAGRVSCCQQQDNSLQCQMCLAVKLLSLHWLGRSDCKLPDIAASLIMVYIQFITSYAITVKMIFHSLTWGFHRKIAISANCKNDEKNSFYKTLGCMQGDMHRKQQSFQNLLILIPPVLL